MHFNRMLYGTLNKPIDKHKPDSFVGKKWLCPNQDEYFLVPRSIAIKLVFRQYNVFTVLRYFTILVCEQFWLVSYHFILVFLKFAWLS